MTAGAGRPRLRPRPVRPLPWPRPRAAPGTRSTTSDPSHPPGPTPAAHPILAGAGGRRRQGRSGRRDDRRDLATRPRPRATSSSGHSTSKAHPVRPVQPVEVVGEQQRAEQDQQRADRELGRGGVGRGRRGPRPRAAPRLRAAVEPVPPVGEPGASAGATASPPRHHEPAGQVEQDSQALDEREQHEAEPHQHRVDLEIPPNPAATPARTAAFGGDEESAWHAPSSPGWPGTSQYAKGPRRVRQPGGPSGYAGKRERGQVSEL